MARSPCGPRTHRRGLHAGVRPSYPRDMVARAVAVGLLPHLRRARDHIDRGGIGGLGLAVDDCRKTYEDLSARGVTFLQEPADRPYGVEAVMRDNSGNWLVLVESKTFTPADFA
ncbi:VOC family protein [Pseudonocardia oceani]|uniref:VOC family protein n=1 Tax=Pseudonocardia oceani TaxID=2792013 RepID=UPI0035565DA7